MKGLFRTVCFLLASLSSVTHAAPITYDFSAWDFYGFLFAGVPPDLTLDGSFTLDGTEVLDIDLTIAGHTFQPAEVTLAYDSYWDSYFLGGVAGGPLGVRSFYPDFYIQFRGSEFISFVYTTKTEYYFFLTDHGSLTARAHNVPEPASYLLLVTGMIAACLARCNTLRS